MITPLQIRRSRLLLATLVLAAFSQAAHAQFAPMKPEHGPPRTYDAHALEMLQEMAETYAHIPSLDQQTEFFSTIIPLAADGTPIPVASRGDAFGAAVPAGLGGERKLSQTFSLRYLAPNRLWLERADQVGATDEEREVWVSDGHDFWTYRRPKNWYTRDKAPATLKLFGKLPTMTAGSLEVIMMMGVNPFISLKDTVEAIQASGTKTVSGVQTDVVTLRSEAPGQIIDTRLYIGTADHLLRRLEIETSPKAAVTHTLGKQGDPLDELVDKAQPAQPEPSQPSMQIKSIVRYDNVIKPSPAFTPDMFSFTPPSDALFQQPIERNGKYAQEQMEKQIDAILKQMNQGKSVPKKILDRQ